MIYILVIRSHISLQSSIQESDIPKKVHCAAFFEGDSNSLLTCLDRLDIFVQVGVGGQKSPTVQIDGSDLFDGTFNLMDCL